MYTQVVIRHLKDQLAQSIINTEKLAASKVKEETLESRLKQLTDELQEAKKFQSPVRYMFFSIYIVHSLYRVCLFS